MTSRTIRKTWEEFWGAFLMLRCHQDSPERWSRRQARADWLFTNLTLRPDIRILDLGCGYGILDICLAQRGAKVTAVVRIASVLDAARQEPGSEKVNFILGDLRGLSISETSFDVVLMLELAGLLGMADDVSLVRRAKHWLRQHGLLVLDCPSTPETPEGRTRQLFDDGVLEYHWTFDVTTRLQHIVPEFRMTSGETIELHDPYDPSQQDHVGVLRYLYPKDEMVDLLVEAGFSVREVAPSWREGYYLLIGESGA